MKCTKPHNLSAGRTPAYENKNSKLGVIISAGMWRLVKFLFACKIVVVCSDEGDTSSCSEDEQAGEEGVDRDCCFTPTVPPPSPVLPHHRSAKVKFSVHLFFEHRISLFSIREKNHKIKCGMLKYLSSIQNYCCIIFIILFTNYFRAIVAEFNYYKIF